MKVTKLWLLLCLTSCATWNEEFEGDVVRAHPKASIHKINVMTDNGSIREADDNLPENFAESYKAFKDGIVSRGAEDIRRMYMMTYEDPSKNLHMAHHLYLIVKPTSWVIEAENGTKR